MNKTAFEYLEPENDWWKRFMKEFPYLYGNPMGEFGGISTGSLYGGAPMSATESQLNPVYSPPYLSPQQEPTGFQAEGGGEGVTGRGLRPGVSDPAWLSNWAYMAGLPFGKPPADYPKMPQTVGWLSNMISKIAPSVPIFNLPLAGWRTAWPMISSALGLNTPWYDFEPSEEPRFEAGLFDFGPSEEPGSEPMGWDFGYFGPNEEGRSAPGGPEGWDNGDFGDLGPSDEGREGPW